MVDQLLGGLFGTQDQDDEPTRRRRAHDFIDRHERGAHDQMSNAEVLQNYRAATAGLSPDDYQRAATDAFRQMSPEQRRELRREMRQRSRDRYGAQDDTPEEMGRAMRQAHEENRGSGGLAGLFGLGGGNDARAGEQQKSGLEGMLDNPLVKVGIAGIAAMAAKKLTEPKG
ncbi:MAG: hypothetical protein IT338_09690 [Thermomicrobiales bacterium]|nr:hypothetical protein [Thermomicrobiales bacterium]